MEPGVGDEGTPQDLCLDYATCLERFRLGKGDGFVQVIDTNSMVTFISIT